MLVQAFRSLEHFSTARACPDPASPLVPVTGSVHKCELHLSTFWSGFSPKEPVKEPAIVRGKKPYRGKGKCNRKENSFTILMVNMRGIKSKEGSLKKILRKVKPSAVTLNETLLTGNMKVSIPPYSWWTKNRKDKGGGGIATGVSQEYKGYSVGVGEGSENDEYLITRIEAYKPALNIINCYGEQRGTRKEEVEEKWGRIRSEMEGIRARNELCLLQGDLNKLIGEGPLGVPGNNKEVSLGGRLLRDLLATGNWCLINGLGQEIVSGGPFTRKDPASEGLSCLDLFVASRELVPYVSKLHIDSERNMAVARAVKCGGKYELVYSDHYTCILTLNDLPRVQERGEEKQVVWNLAREGGWAGYKVLTKE